MDYYERIQLTIDYIEENLDSNINIQQLSKLAYFSVSQFYYIFQAVVGETVKEYTRKRRLCKAALDLMSTNKKIVDIAYDAMFESQEAFSRAFAKIYGVTPGRYRKNGGNSIYSEKINILSYIHRGGYVEDRFKVGIAVESEAKVVGMEFFTNEHDALYNNSLINFESSQFCPRIGEIKNTSDKYLQYGITKCPSEDVLYYMAGIKVNNFVDVPKGMIGYTIPAYKYSVLTYNGAMNPAIDSEMKRYAFGIWLPNSGYEWADDFVINVFKYDNFSERGNLIRAELYIPIQ